MGILKTWMRKRKLRKMDSPLAENKLLELELNQDWIKNKRKICSICGLTLDKDEVNMCLRGEDRYIDATMGNM